MEEAPDLDKMLREARAAQAANDQAIQDGEVEATAVANAGLEQLLQEREEIVDERRTAEDERLGAVDLLAQGTELSAGSEVLAPETEAFLNVAEQTVQDRRAQLESLNERLVTLDADPAVRNVLYQEAKDENRRIEVQKSYQECYYVKAEGREHGGTMHEVLRQVSPDYEQKISGTNIGDDPLCQLEGFTFQASGLYKGEKTKGTIDEAEDAAQRMTLIRQEIETGNPDVKKMDDVLSEFLYKRLEHFFATLDQRVEARAQQLMGYYNDNPEEAAKYPNKPTNIDDWKQQLNNSMRNIGSKMQEATHVMESGEFKARALARIGQDVFQIASCGCGVNGDQYPYHPDGYKEPVKSQEVA